MAVGVYSPHRYFLIKFGQTSLPCGELLRQISSTSQEPWTPPARKARNKRLASGHSPMFCSKGARGGWPPGTTTPTPCIVPALSHNVCCDMGAGGLDGLQELPDQPPVKRLQGWNGLQEVPDPPRFPIKMPETNKSKFVNVYLYSRKIHYSNRHKERTQ